MSAQPHYSGDIDAPAQVEFVTFARQLAEASGKIIRQYFHSSFAVEIKADASPVTVADRKAEEAMRDLIMAAYPDHGILGEELGAHQPDAAYQWVLDPIDGTKSFISGTYLFGTLIALLKNGRPILGVIHHPVPGDLLMGTAAGAWLNERPVSVRACQRIEDAVLLTTSHWAAFRHQNGPAFESLSRRAHMYRTWGDCHGYFLVATGGADIMCDPVMHAWDLLALVPIIEGAGGRITDWQGRNPVGVGGNGVAHSIVATSGDIHDEVIQALNP